MGSYSPPETKMVRGVVFRRDPAREECFRVVHLHKEMENLSDMSDMSRRQRIHQHMHNEMQSLEIAAQCIVDFPDTDWELQMELARQCWDETRHTQMLYNRLRALGGYKGEFAVMNYEWGITCMLDSLAARLALQNRTFEGGEMDLLRELDDTWRQAGDDDTADLLAGRGASRATTPLGEAVMDVRFREPSAATALQLALEPVFGRRSRRIAALAVAVSWTSPSSKGKRLSR